MIQAIFRSNFVLFGIAVAIALVDERNISIKALLISVIVPLVFLGISYAVGFRDISLLSLIIMFAVPTAVSSFQIAKYIICNFYKHLIKIGTMYFS